jgi:hypothetical protein
MTSITRPARVSLAHPDHDPEHVVDVDAATLVDAIAPHVTDDMQLACSFPNLVQYVDPAGRTLVAYWIG